MKDTSPCSAAREQNSRKPVPVLKDKTRQEKMSFISKDGAERKFWRSPELVETLLPFLDSVSTKRLTESHQLTLQLLGKPIIWGKLVKRTFPVDEKFDSARKAPPMASEKAKARSLAGILSLEANAAQPRQLEKALLHAICRRFPHISGPHSNWVNLTSSCFHMTCDMSCEIYQVSSWGFLVLEEVGAIWSSADLGILNVDSHGLKEPFLSALSSRAITQHKKVEQLEYDYVTLNSVKSVESWATLMEQSETMPNDELDIYVEDEIGTGGWATIQRELERLSATRVMQISVISDRKAMGAGRKEDMRAIWKLVSAYWIVKSGDGVVNFDKGDGGELTGWHGFWDGRRWKAGLDKIIEMTDEEWDEETNI